MLNHECLLRGGFVLNPAALCRQVKRDEFLQFD